MDDSLIPKTSNEWFDLLSIEENKTSNSYLAKPATMIGDYSSEIATTRDYEGREILELLQNAADQAREGSVRGRVVIELLPEGLVIANTGAAFSLGGVLSLENAYLSPKRRQRRQFIGNKGLGFRSVLNWTHSPIILSGALSLAYSQLVSQKKLEELVNKSTELSALVADEKDINDNLVIPILPFPGYKQDGCIDDFIEDNSAAQRLLERCESWREKNYSTAIGMPFEDPSFYAAALKQIKLLRPEILLFVEHLNEIRFLIPEEDERVWLLDGKDTASMVIENNEPLGIWQVHRAKGEVPDDQLDKDQKSPLSYELIVAVPEVETLDELQVSPLFSYFPTTITLPLPVVCHATLELDQSRNHIQQRLSNTYVFKRLVEFLANIAEKRAVDYPSGIKAGFRILMALETYPHDLKREEFSEQLMRAAAERAIIPTLNNQAVLAKQALSLPGADRSWLPVSIFGEIVPVSNMEEHKFFNCLGVKKLKAETLRQRLLAIKDLSQLQRAALITGMILHNIPTEAYSSALLLGSNGEKIPDHATVFIAPHGGVVPTLPDWVTLWFLDDELRRELQVKLNLNDVRELQSKLASFGLREYSFARLVGRLVAAANQSKKKQPHLSISIDQKLLNTLFNLYQDEGKSGNLPSFPDKTTLSLPSQAGINVSVHTLYLGQGYGVQGNIVQALYEGWAPELLIVEHKALGLPNAGSILPDFLKWLGVAAWPREKILKNPSHEYEKHLLDRIQYPSRFGDYIFETRQQVVGTKMDSVKTMNGLDKILQHADPMAITAWLALDVRSTEWVRSKPEHANLSAKKGEDRNLRRYQGSLPSYIRWKLESTKWLLDKDRHLLRPKDCVLGIRAIEALFPRPAKASSESLRQYGITDSDLIVGWRHGGVLTSLAELELDDIYSRLLELPQQQPEGKSARNLYRWLLNAVDSALGEGGNARDRFFTEGRMWGHIGNESSYFPVAELHHADSEGLPTALLDRLKIVDLPHRIGAEKVKQVFGVEPIDRIAIKQKLKSYHLETDLDPEFQEAKPFLFLLRASQSSQTQYLGTLKRLHLKVCSELQAEMEYGGNKFNFELPVWGWLIDEDVLYVRSDPAELVDSTHNLLADTIGVAIASIFRIGNGDEFTLMFLCRQKNRKALLKRMRGEAAEENMDKIIEEFGQSIEKDRLAILPEIGTIEEPKPTDPKNTNVNSDNSTTKNDQSDQTKSDAPESINTPLSIEQVEHQSQPAPARQSIRVQRNSSNHTSHSTTHRVTDPEFVERKVMEIEASFEPPRYPLRVGQITGADAPGCDILSFNCAEHRDKFKTGEDRDLNKVIRFIEVKGRKHEKAEIELRGNEWDTAVEHSDRYYLYRLYKSGENDYTLSILHNPLDSKEALERSVYVHLNRAEKMEKYEVSGGMLPSET